LSILEEGWATQEDEAGDKMTENTAASSIGSQTLGGGLSASQEGVMGSKGRSRWQARVRAIFRHLAIDGEVSCDDLEHALRLLGYPTPSEDLVAQVDMRRKVGRSFVDWEEFRYFCSRYGELFQCQMMRNFSGADKRRSGIISFEDLVDLLRRDGIRPFSYLLHALLVDALGISRACFEFRFCDYIRAFLIAHGRGGMLDLDLSRVKTVAGRMDRDGRGVVAQEDLPKALDMLGFVVRSKVVPALLPDGKPLSELPYLTFIRRYRDSELDSVMRVLRTSGFESGATAPLEEVSDAFLALGYELATPGVIQEALMLFQRSLLDAPVESTMATLWTKDGGSIIVGYEPLYVILERMRHTRGLLECELQEASAAYEAYAAARSMAWPHSLGVSILLGRGPTGRALRVAQGDAGGEAGTNVGQEQFVVALLGAMRSLGFAVNLWSLLWHLDDLGFDERGRVDQEAFLQLVAAVRRSEFRQLRNASASGKVLRPKLHEALFRMGYGMTEITSEDRVGIWDAEAMLKGFRAKNAALVQQNLGFSVAEKRCISEEFLDAESDAVGALRPKGIAKLFTALFPGSATDNAEHARARALYKAAVAESDGEMHIQEYILLRRLAEDDGMRLQTDRELAMIGTTEFTRSEIKEFRTIFRDALFAHCSDGAMSLAEFSALVSRIVPVRGRDMEREFRDKFLELSVPLPSERGEKVIFFGEFLCAMHQLVKLNWRGINDAAASISSVSTSSGTSPAFSEATAAEGEGRLKSDPEQRRGPANEPRHAESA